MRHEDLQRPTGVPAAACCNICNNEERCTISITINSNLVLFMYVALHIALENSAISTVLAVPEDYRSTLTINLDPFRTSILLITRIAKF